MVPVLRLHFRPIAPGPSGPHANNATTTPAPFLSRGDDAIGPALAARCEALGLPEVEVIVDFQLAPEHALDLAGRVRVIFVDAGKGTLDPYELRRVEARDDFTYTSHAMSPEAVLATYARVTGAAPPEAWVLCVRGESFELGEALSAAAAARLEAACGALGAFRAYPSGPFDLRRLEADVDPRNGPPIRIVEKLGFVR